MLQGPNLDLLRDVCAATDRPVVASGGITELDDLRALMGLVGDGVEGAIVGTALYEGRFTLDGARWSSDARRMTLAVRVIPCLDVDAGRVVKGVNFQRAARRRRPGRAGRALRRRGRRRADLPRHLRLPRGPRHDAGGRVAARAEQVFIPLTVGGGVSCVDDVDRLLRAGADKVAVNTAAIHRPELVAEIADRFGNQVLVLSVDARRAAGHRLRLRGDHPRRPQVRRPRRGRVGEPRLRARRRRDPAQRDGRRRHPGRLRPRADPRRTPRGHHPGDRQRRRRARPSTSRRPSTPAPTPCWRPPSSTSARCAIGEVKAALAAAGHPVR